MAITITAGAWASGSTTCAPALPASPQAGDVHVIFITGKPYNTVINTLAGWTAISGTDGANGTVANGTDVGSVHWAAFYRRWQSGDSATPSFSITSGNTTLGVAIRLRPESGYSIVDPVGCKGFDNTSGTGYSATMDANPGITTGDVVINFTGLPGNNATFASPTITATGATIGTVTENPATEGSTATGLDSEASAATATCTAGTSSAAPVVGWTLSAAQTGGGAFVRVRQSVPQLDQDSFRFRNDDGSESTATWKDVLNANVSLPADAIFRLRFLIQHTDTVPISNKQFRFQYRLNSGTWTDITNTSSVLTWSTSSGYTGGTDCVQRLGAGTFISDNDGMTENEFTAAVPDFAANDEVEIENCFQIVTADVTNGDTIDVRVIDYNFSVLTAYTNTPRVTVIVSQDVEVSATVVALVLSPKQATISYDVEILAAVEALTLVTYTADVSLGIDVAATTAGLTLTTHAANINAETNVLAALAELDLATYVANIALDVAVAATTASLALTTYAATVTTGGAGDVDVQAATAALTLTVYPASISFDVDVQAITCSLTLTTHAATVTTGPAATLQFVIMLTENLGLVI